MNFFPLVQLPEATGFKLDVEQLFPNFWNLSSVSPTTNTYVTIKLFPESISAPHCPISCDCRSHYLTQEHLLRNIGTHQLNCKACLWGCNPKLTKTTGNSPTYFSNVEIEPLNSDHIRKTEICFRFLNLPVALAASLPHTEMCPGPEPRTMKKWAMTCHIEKTQKTKPTDEQQKPLPYYNWILHLSETFT